MFEKAFNSSSIILIYITRTFSYTVDLQEEEEGRLLTKPPSFMQQQWQHDLVATIFLNPSNNACSVLRAVFALMHLCGQSSCSSVLSSNVITRGGEEGWGGE